MAEFVDGVVVVDYQDLLKPAGQLNEHIKTAFGNESECLGIIFIKNVPGYAEKRKRLLPIASKFAQLPNETKEKYVHAECNYQFGWSHGKEIFNGKPDITKGSYYNNPQYDSPLADDFQSKDKAGEYVAHNVWPMNDDCPELEPAFKDLGRLIVAVGEIFAQHCDAYVSSVRPSTRPNFLSSSIRQSRSCKARLLHYFARTDAGDKISDQPASWCGWHLDHGSLTGLTSAMYMKDDLQEVSNPDPAAGLYIRNRKGDLVKAVIPAEYLAFQVGQSTQIDSGGVLRATWHSVQAAAGEAAIGVARNTFAVFMQPNFDYVFQPPTDATEEEIDTPEWRPDQTFANFTVAVTKKYYN